MSQNPVFLRWALAGWIVVSQLAALMSLLGWFGFAGMSLLAFDAGVSPAAAAFVGIIWAYPLLPLGLGIWSWLAFKGKKDKLALLLASAQFVPACGLALYLLPNFM